MQLLKNLFKFSNVECIFYEVIQADVTKIALLFGFHYFLHNIFDNFDLYFLLLDQIERENYLPRIRNLLPTVNSETEDIISTLNLKLKNKSLQAANFLTSCLLRIPSLLLSNNLNIPSNFSSEEVEAKCLSKETKSLKLTLLLILHKLFHAKASKGNCPLIIRKKVVKSSQ